MLRPSIYGENLFDDLFDGFFDFPVFDDKAIRKAQRELYGRHGENMMKTDVQEHDGYYEVDIDLPGFKKEELSLELRDGSLTITAAKGIDREERETEHGKFVRKERYAGSMSRSFYIGDNVKEEDIHAKYENGVLRLTVPKPESEQVKVPEKKYIAIEG